MTLEERINNALDKCAMSGWRLAVLQAEITCVAQAAVEEDRKTRECCKAERDKAIKEIVEIIDDVDIHTRKEILEEIDKIRARSDS